MDHSFNPYHRWLGIRDAVLPPHHYRLLGLEPFEENPNVIQAAAERQMGHVRSFANGPQASYANQLLGELSAARVCLLNPHRKQEYDEQLRARLASQPAQPQPQSAPVSPVTAAAAQIPPPQPEPEPETNWQELEHRLAQQENPNDLFEGDIEARRRAVFSPFVKAAAIGWCITLVVVVCGWAYLSSQPKPDYTGPKVIHKIHVVEKKKKPKPKPPPRTGPPELEVDMVLRGHTASVWSVAWLGKRELVSGSIDRSVRTWDLMTMETAQQIQSPESVSMLTAHAETRHVAFCGPDGSVRLWQVPEVAPADTEADQPFPAESELLVMHTAEAHCVTFSPNGQQLASGDAEGTVLVYNLKRIVQQQLKTESGAVESVTFTPDGKRLLAGAADGNIHTWTLDDGQRGDMLRGHEFAVLATAMSPTGLVLSGGKDRTLRMWRLVEGKPRQVTRYHQSPIRAVAISPDGKLLASADLGGAVCLWNVLKEEPLAVGKAHQAAVFSIAFSPDGKQLATASSDTTIRVWNLPAD